MIYLPDDTAYGGAMCTRHDSGMDRLWPGNCPVVPDLTEPTLRART